MTSAHGLGWNDLRLLRVVAVTGSFTSAAAALHFTQSGLSRRVAQLERAVGGAIFTRLPRGVQPTALGELLLAHADDLLQRFETMIEDLEAVRAGTGGRLRVGAFPTANSSLVPEALGRFRAGHPDVVVSLLEALSPALLAEVAVGGLDLAVISDYPTGSLDFGDTRRVHLLDDELRVALPASHPRSRQPRLHLADLADETWIGAPPEGVDNVLTLAAARAGFEPRVTMRVATWAAKLSYVAAGLGITIIPACSPPVPPNVVIKPLEGDLPARRIFAAVAHHPPTAAESLLAHLQAAAGTETCAASARGDH